MATNRQRNRNNQPAIPAWTPGSTRPRRSSWITRKVNDTTPQQQPGAHLLSPNAYLTVPGAYTTRRGKVVWSSSQPAPPQLPQLPQLGLPLLGSTTTALTQVLLPGLPGPASARRPGESTAHAAAVLRRVAWRYRWQLAPAAATLTAVTGAAVGPAATTLGLGVVAGAGFVTATKGPDQIAGRAWLSRAERIITARWAVSAAVWTAGVGVANGVGIDWSPSAVVVAAGALASLTGAPAAAWLGSRRIRKDSKPKRSAAAQQLVAAWPTAVGRAGPDGLLGSFVVDIAEPDPGTIVVDVQLRDGVHAETVANRDTRRWLERALHMGVDTAKVELRRDHAGQVRVVLTPTRHLEQTSKVWPGPVLHPDGRIPIAVTPDGREACIRLYAHDGVRHLMMIGSTGSGKTNAYNVILLPGVLAGKSVLVYLDGKRGTSSPELAAAMDHVALKPDEWLDAIEMVHTITLDREDRYGEMGLSTFAVDGPDPIIELVIDEGTTVARALPERHEVMLQEISERGRALGVALRVGVQRPDAEATPGGIRVRDNLMGAAGNVIGLRPGGTVSKGLTLTATSAEIDLLGLPEGGGWCAILREGAVESEKARVLWIPDGSHTAKHLAGFTPRTLTGADAVAAGETYANRRTGAQWLEAMQPARARRDGASGSSVAVRAETETKAAEARAAAREQARAAETAAAANRTPEGVSGVVSAVQKFKAAQGATSRHGVLSAIRRAGDTGVTSADLVATLGLSKSTINRIISELIKAGDAERDTDNRVRLVAAQAAA